MKKTWDNLQVEIIPMRISAEQYEQSLEEFAEIVYRHLCQLPDKDILVPETASTMCLERTGTDE